MPSTPPIAFAAHSALSKLMIFGDVLPEGYDPNRVTILYFAYMARRMCGDNLDEEETKRMVEWIYTQQVPLLAGGGFRPSHTMPLEGHVTMAQCAVLLLSMVGDDLSRIDREGMKTHLRSLQTEEGGFRCVIYGESDVRFLYSACVVAKVLDIWDAINVPLAIQYIKSCIRYDGGIGNNAHCEGHGGTTFCGIASLSMMGRLDVLDKRRTMKWLVSRATCTEGFNGRPNKDADTCYTYWVGSSLRILEGEAFVALDSALRFVSACQGERGGIAKDEESRPDILHTALPLMGVSNLKGWGETLPKVDVALGALLQ